MTEPTHEQQPQPKEVKPAKKGSFKRKMIGTLAVAGLGVVGYGAYTEGMVDENLPPIIKSSNLGLPTIGNLVMGSPQKPVLTADQASSIAEHNQGVAATNVTATSTMDNGGAHAEHKDALASADGSQNASSNTNVQQTVGNVVGAAAGASSSASSTPSSLSGLAGVTPDASSGIGAAASNTNANGPVPILVSLNGSAGNGMIMAMDAQWQWQQIQNEFLQKWQVTDTKTQIEVLKKQLQMVNSAALVPTINAMTKVEDQLNAWQQLDPQGLTRQLQETIAKSNGITVRTIEDQKKDVEKEAGETSLFARFLQSFGGLITVKKSEGESVKAVDASTVPIVKQSIQSQLLSAQWAAKTGDWTQAQQLAASAMNTAKEWGSPEILSGVEKLATTTAWPALPDFSSVSMGLQQAKMSLIEQARNDGKAMAANMPKAVAPVKADTKSEAKPEAKNELKNEPKADVKPEGKADAKDATKSATGGSL